ncbi:MAG: SUMF1/EgtB/PvdO family nonheme iron enzyme [Gemmataceae bacterium]|nr:SUMF1/EgtB/PvdO family nonheme iron enzyme [Gemmataceae bacterium]MCI0739726.1 SUMF1/EgtB/PvdO family nonheme iron enzyme [Gemmataceae bacterium]
MNVCACPAPKELENYLLGRLDPDMQSAIDDHLEECAACLSAVDVLDQRANAIFARLGQAHSSGVNEEYGFARLLHQVKALENQSADAPDRLPIHPTPKPGDVLDNYLLLEPIGAGGMGRVFKAEHQRMKRLVALKLIAPQMVRSPAARERFQREIEAVSRLTSPHIVAAFDARECNGHDFLVMEYVSGRNLAQVVKEEGPLSVDRALHLVRQAARGLEHAHVAGIVHRDVKPANLLLDDKGVVKVSDLGLARIHDTKAARERTNAVDTSLVMGTAAYMAPEQAAGCQDADPRSDIYSVGCTLFFLLTGRPPYGGKGSVEVLLAHRDQPIPALQSLRPDCPVAVIRLFEKLVAKRPQDRPASMADVGAEIDLIGRGAHRSFAARRWLWAAGLVMAAALVILAVVLPRLGNSANERVASQENSSKAVVGNKAPTIDMVRVLAGEVWLGSSDSDPLAGEDEKPRRRIKITQPFLLGKTKITQAQYLDVMGENPSAFSAKGRFQERVKDKDTSQHPVESISWLAAVRFCNRLSERHELQPYYQIDNNVVTIRGGNGYRLPTEAEWEHACRAGTTTTWPFGENRDDLGQHAWFAANSGDRTHPVAQKKANPLGLFDMLGNVPEWCWDRYDPAYYKRMPLSDPPGSGTGETRVHRGGAWNFGAAQVRPAARESRGITYGVLTIVGLRVARNVD